MLKSWFSSKKVSLATLGTDIHSHLVPGVDDGSKNIDQSIGILLKFIDLGYKKLIITPHVKSGVFDNSTQILQSAFSSLQEEVKRLNLPISLELAAEYFLDEHLMSLLEKKDLLTFEKNHLLFELAFKNPPGLLNDFIFSAQLSGYQLVIAHFERYEYYFGSLEIAEQLKTKNVKIQVNLNSFSGHYGPEIRKQALRLMDADMIDILGTDCHRIEHLQLLEEQLDGKTFKKLLNKSYLNAKF